MRIERARNRVLRMSSSRWQAAPPRLRLRQQRSHVVHATQVDVAILAQQAPRLGGFGQPLPGQADVVGRQRFQHQLAAGGEAGVSGQPLKDLVEFEDMEGFGVHTAKSIA